MCEQEKKSESEKYSWAEKSDSTQRYGTTDTKMPSAQKAPIFSRNFYASVSMCSDLHTYLLKFTPSLFFMTIIDKLSK